MADIRPFAGMAQETTLIESLLEIAARLADIGDSVGNIMPDVSGRIRVAAESVANIATITTVSTVTNAQQIGGMNASLHIHYLSQIAEDALASNIVRA